MPSRGRGEDGAPEGHGLGLAEAASGAPVVCGRDGAEADTAGTTDVTDDSAARGVIGSADVDAASRATVAAVALSCVAGAPIFTSDAGAERRSRSLMPASAPTIATAAMLAKTTPDRRRGATPGAPRRISSFQYGAPTSSVYATIPRA